MCRAQKVEIMKIATDPQISNALKIPGWMSERELIWLGKMAQNCQTIVEFGSYLGRSTRALADNCEGRIWAVDPWNGDYFLEDGNKLDVVNTYVMPIFIENLRNHIIVGKVFPTRNFSNNFDLPFEVDMVFIDGDHRYTTVQKDIQKAIKLVKKGGIISGHDYNFSTWPGVKKAVDETFKDVKVEETIWWTIK